MTSTDEKENKRKFAWWVKDSTIELVGKLYKDDDCTSRSEFIEKAVIFYSGYLSTENAKGYLPKVLRYRWRVFIGTQPSTTRVTIPTFTSWCTATDLKSHTSHGKAL